MYASPGPTILSTAAIVFVPYASAATAAAPPARYSPRAPTFVAAYASAGSTLPSFGMGDTSTRSATAATPAGTPIISAVDG